MLPDSVILDHVAVAVPDIEQAKTFYQSLGLKFDTPHEIVASQAVETAFAAVDENCHLELLMPVGETGPIHQFLSKKGPGIHHLCFKVKDLKLMTEKLTQQGCRFLYDSAQSGANNKLINFIHPKSSGGVLIELSQDCISPEAL